MTRKHKDKKADKFEPEMQDDQIQAEPDETIELDPIKVLEKERDDLMQRLQRVSADFRNYQTRAQRDLDQAREFANERLLRDMLPVLDDMERVLDAARENHGEEDTLFQGMQMVHDQALSITGRFGLNVSEAKEGQPFDPQHHTAMMRQPSADHEANTILHVAQKGYELKGRTLRAASVVVSAPIEDEPAADSDVESPAEE